MDVNQPMPKLITLNPNITNFKDQDGQNSIVDGSRIPWSKRGVMAEFVAISLREPKSLEYSYLLRGFDKDWGAPTTNRTVSYSSLPPGDYRFQVRARYPGDTWSEQTASRGFSLSAPFWRTAWFAMLVLLIVACALYLLARFRTRQIETANRRLREEVNQRTRSIENARLRLEQSNQELSRLVHEREQADLAREEVETRFRQAFENTPIGMGMLSPDGELLDGNPALRRMLWPDLAANDSCGSFVDRIDERSREDFLRLHQKLSSGARDTTEAEFVCKDTNGETLHTVVTLAAVREQDREIKYSVLQVQDVTEARKLNRQLEYQANYDELTGLLNRRSFEKQLERAYKQSATAKVPSYLMFMDLDQFKVVNDTCGHVAGDALLRQFSHDLLPRLRSRDTLARLGGDEFGLLLEHCSAADALTLVNEVCRTIGNSRFHWGDSVFRVTGSIGLVVIDASCADLASVMMAADAACYAAKAAGGDRVHVYQAEDAAMADLQGQMRWVTRITDALDQHRFELVAQPYMPLAPVPGDSQEALHKFEVLVRMREADGTVLKPGEFLLAAERYNLAPRIDQWVVGETLKLLSTSSTLLERTGMCSINLSGHSLQNERFIDYVLGALESSNVPAHKICFELTETAALTNLPAAVGFMNRVRRLGCLFALDDFGTGASSFGYLRNLPVDFIKIDGIFVRDMAQDKVGLAMVKAIADVARVMGKKTVAEFVEGDEALMLLKDIGVDYAQGYRVGRPRPLASFDKSNSVVTLSSVQ